MPILKKHLFLPGLNDAAFRLWSERGIVSFQDLYKDGVLCSFTQLSADFNLPPSHLFRLFQIRHCASSLFSDLTPPSIDQPYDNFLDLDPSQQALISKIYSRLMDINPHSLN